MQVKMSETEAIEFFKNEKDCVGMALSGRCDFECDNCSMGKNREYMIDAFETAIQVLEKQTPKKIVYRKQSYGTPYMCPECNADQVKVEFFNEDGSEPPEKHSYCWKCGQKLDWSEEE